MSYLRYLCLFVYSGVQHILCSVFFGFVCLRLVFVFPMLPVSLDCLFLIAHSVFSSVYVPYIRLNGSTYKDIIHHL